jgi:hypothetical protein
MVTRAFFATDHRDESEIALRLLAIAANGLDRAAGEGFFAEILFLVGFGLLVNVGVTAVVIALEVGGRGLAAEVTINALVVNVVGSRCVMGILVSGVGHLL